MAVTFISWGAFSTKTCRHWLDPTAQASLGADFPTTEEKAHTVQMFDFWHAKPPQHCVLRERTQNGAGGPLGHWMLSSLYWRMSILSYFTTAKSITLPVCEKNIPMGNVWLNWWSNRWTCVFSRAVHISYWCNPEGKMNPGKGDLSSTYGTIHILRNLDNTCRNGQFCDPNTGSCASTAWKNKDK